MRQKGFLPILIVIILALVGVVGYLAYQKTQLRNPLPTPTQTPFSVTTSVPTQTTPVISTVKKIGYIKSITPNYDTYQLKIDYIDFVQDSSAPNGFRIENPSTEITSLPVEQNPTIIMQTFSHLPDGNFNFNQLITFSQFLDSFNSGSSTKGVPYWVEMQNGTVTKITEQYIP